MHADQKCHTFPFTVMLMPSIGLDVSVPLFNYLYT